MKRKTTLSLCFLALSPLASMHAATLFETSFSATDGFLTRSPAPYIVGDPGFDIVFNGFQQDIRFHGPAYSSGPEALFAINGTYTGSFGRSLTDTTDIATILFPTTAASIVSFTAIDLANGTPTIRAYDTANNLLSTVSVTETNARAAGALVTFDSAALGGAISRIEFDNAGPAMNPPYGLAIDTFSAEAVPEPSSLMLTFLGAGLLLRRRR